MQYASPALTTAGGYGQLSAEAIALAKAALNPGKLSEGDLHKSITISTGLTAYDLQAPAKNLYPTITPLRNSVPRVGRTNPGDAARWRSILSITGSGYDSMGWIPEGQRSASMSYSATPVAAPYLTIGEEDTLSFEAEAAAAGFEDVNATLTMRLLQKMMRKEENAILGGNASLALATTPTPSLSASGSGGTLPANGTGYFVSCVALAYEGYKNSSVSLTGVPTTSTFVGNDGLNYTLNGGAAQVSAQAGPQVVTSGQTLFATVTPVVGAVAYAWYVGLTTGATLLQAITGINSIAISTPLITGTQSVASAPSSDYSRNSGLAFDGFLNIAANPANNAYYKALGTGTAGSGTTMTPSGRGSINEIDDMLISMWNNYRLSPTVLYVNAQQQKDITSKVLTSASGPLVRYNVNQGANPEPYEIAASGVVRWYYNPFSVDTGFDIPIKVHPDMPPGTILGYCERLPMWYQNNETENPFAMQLRRDYYRIDWPLRTRRREYGVYCEETLAAYAPFACGVITNVAPG